MQELERFKKVMRTLRNEVENQYIENMVYFEIILESGVISLADLNEKVETALLDSRRRAEAHNTYSEMRKAIEESEDGALFEDLLKNLPSSDKPN